MSNSRLTYRFGFAGTIFSLALALNGASGCSAPTNNDPQGTGGSSGTGTGGSSGPGTGGSSSTGSAGTMGSGGSGNSSGSSGTTGTGGSVVSTAGTTGSAGNGSTGSGGSAGSTGSAGRGGTTGSAGNTGSGGSAGATGSAGRGGTTGSAGSGGSAGATGSGGAAGSGPRVDQGGIPLGKPGDMQATSKKYINLGDMRLINNRWGSDELNCTQSMQKVYINSDKTIGWDFNRPACGGAKAKPDYPEVEFGVAPFGSSSNLLTTPAFSSTTLLPIQVTSLTSASVNIDNLFISLQKNTTYNINVEFWLSQRNPLTDPNPGVYAEIIAFWGWEPNRNNSSAGGWSCGSTEQSKGNMTSGSSTYNLCHQSDNWSSGWRFYNFNVNNGPLTAYTGTVDVKAMIDWVVSKYGIPNNLWLTRIEVGSEIDDNTQGSVKLKNLTFEINKQTRSFEFGQ
jgi:hypothetical protein